ncbi:hypothetical protein PAPYR_13438 [Paratrimastix pyriformis]|uniref:Uncharacterized protein n=1 Tax=Paratrimastix pyriformis TaxID=342808 RepID=A0ABQ8U1R9_9EUKA|nr:hypothetical protein PAPYR_13438 [Paratrimastix pyriformis]
MEKAKKSWPAPALSLDRGMEPNLSYVLQPYQMVNHETEILGVRSGFFRRLSRWKPQALQSCLVSVDGNDAKLLCLDLGQDFAIIKQTIASHFNVAQISKISFLVTSYGVGPVSTELGADTLPLARLEPHLVFRATSVQ